VDEVEEPLFVVVRPRYELGEHAVSIGLAQVDPELCCHVLHTVTVYASRLVDVSNL
jgi:hypothetical protein